MKIEIVGYGWVGRAMYQLFEDKHEIRITDPIIKPQGKSFKEDPDVAFICVPTPNLPDGSLDCSIVEKAVADCYAPTIIIRSTVMPGTTNRLQAAFPRKDIVLMPEYLGETVAHPLTGQKSREFVILGGLPDARRKAIELLQTVYNASLTIRQVDSTTAEVIKLSENRAIAFKVAQCQELYDACEAAGVDYYEVRQAVYGDDPRFDLWFSFIYPEKRGFQSSCLPKDVWAWKSWAESCGYAPDLTNALLEYNTKLTGKKFHTR